MKLFLRAAALLLCMSCMAGAAAAAAVDCGSTYCFGTEDFSDQPLSGICLTSLPSPKLGVVCLGSRVLRPGDVLTAEQISRMTFSPTDTAADKTAEVGYLPIYPGGSAQNAVMTVSIRGRDNKAPIAEDSAAETYKNLEVTGQLKVSDPENQPMTITIGRQPRRGSVAVSDDGSFTYTPKKNKVGIDSFTYTASDPGGQSSREATVTVTILKPSSAKPYTDTAGRDCCFAAEWMKHSGIFVGETLDGNPCFSPEAAVSQGEFLTMLVKTLKIPTDPEVSPAGYTDAPQWLRPYLAAAQRAGITEGMETFRAEEPMNARAAAELIGSALELEDISVFSPEDAALTRADAAKMLYETSLLAGTSPRPKIWQ